MLRDHDAYAAPTVQRIIERARESGAHVVLVTAKDWAKLRNVRPDAWPCPVAVVRLELTFVRGEASLLEAVQSTVERGVPEGD